jgi:hypothetical protein
MKKFIVLIVVMGIFAVADAQAQPGFCDCYGGMDADGNYWKLLDHSSNPLEDGDWVSALWVGPDGEASPPDMNGSPTGDDVLLPLAMESIERSSFFITVTVWWPEALDSLGDQKHPTDGDLIYCRIFDGPKGSIGKGNYYADSQIHQCRWKYGDQFGCLFPGDPGAGHTDTPIPEGGSPEVDPSEGLPIEIQLRPSRVAPQKPEFKLEYAVPHDGHVTMRIFDISGSEVATLVDGGRKAGLHTVGWNTQGMPPGIYFCRLEVGEHRKTVKMINLQ